MKQNQWFDLPRLGFGLMRLPTTAGAQIDMEQVKQMVDAFMDAGYTYFDTAWGYHNGMSEVVVREAIVERYPREQFVLADKFPIWVPESSDELRPIFETQLSRSGAGYFDYYLAHALDRSRAQKMEQLGVWDFMKDLKARGLVKHIGFSFHDKASVLEDILDKHPEAEFVQLQINYIDWDSPMIEARLCYEACEKRGLPVIVMEPIKGGMLATPPQSVTDVLRAVRPDDSAATWAIRYVGSKDSVRMILSGMSDIDQVKENTRDMSRFQPMDERDLAAISKAVDLLNATPTVGCTACEYCVPECPQSINIPGVIDVYNAFLTYGPIPSNSRKYELATAQADPRSCIGCGACEGACPQHLPIIQSLAAAVKALA